VRASRVVVAVLPDGAHPDEPSAISLLRVARDRAGALEIAGRGWRRTASSPSGTGARR
jgi:hypothetical protein